MRAPRLFDGELGDQTVFVMRTSIDLRRHLAHDEVAARGEVQLEPCFLSGKDVAEGGHRCHGRLAVRTSVDSGEVFAQTDRGRRLDDIGFVRFGAGVANVDDVAARSERRVEREREIHQNKLTCRPGRLAR